MMGIDLLGQVARSRVAPLAGIDLNEIPHHVLRKLYHVFRVYLVFCPNSCMIVVLPYSLFTTDHVLPKNSGVPKYKN